MLRELGHELRVRLPGFEEAGLERADLVHEAGDLMLECLVLLTSGTFLPSSLLGLATNEEGCGTASGVYIVLS